MEDDMTGYYRSPNGGLYHILHGEQRLTMRNVHAGIDVHTNLSPESCHDAIRTGRLTRIHAPVYIEEREEELIARLT